MNIKCPKCKTLFEIESEDLIKSVKKFKCSVCNHLWHVEEKYKERNEESSSSLKKIFLLNVLTMLVFLISVFLFREELEFTDTYWQNLFIFIDTLIPIK